MKGFLTKEDRTKIDSVKSQLQTYASVVEEAVIIFATDKPIRLVLLAVHVVEPMYPWLSFKPYSELGAVFVVISKKDWGEQTT